MRILSFSGILISVIMIFMVYIIFSKELSYQMKTTLIIFVFILAFILFMNLDMFQNYNRLINNITDAKRETRVPRDTLIQNSGNYSLSMWIYVDDWNYKYGQKKTILKRDNNNQKNPHIYLDSHKNNIIVDFYVKEDSNQTSDASNNYDEALQWCKNNVTTISNEDLECNYNPDTDTHEPKIHGLKCTYEELQQENQYECLDGTRVDIPYNSCDIINDDHSATIENIPLQKWFNLSVAFGDNHTDIYLDGKLLTTKSFKGVQYEDEFSKNDFLICSNGGYSGFITKASYYNYLISPQKAWEIYKDGFNNVMLSSVYNKYNAAITFYEDNNERAKYYIV